MPQTKARAEFSDGGGGNQKRSGSRRRIRGDVAIILLLTTLTGGLYASGLSTSFTLIPAEDVPDALRSRLASSPPLAGSHHSDALTEAISQPSLSSPVAGASRQHHETAPAAEALDREALESLIDSLVEVP